MNNILFELSRNEGRRESRKNAQLYPSKQVKPLMSKGNNSRRISASSLSFDWIYSMLGYMAVAVGSSNRLGVLEIWQNGTFEIVEEMGG